MTPVLDVPGFRNASSQFASGISVVTAIGPEDAPLGVTVTSYASVSLDPPTVLVSIHHRCRTLTAILVREAFGINVLSVGQEGLSHRFSASIPNRFASVHWEPGTTGVPLLLDALSHIECVVVGVVEGGEDHRIILGRVLHCRSREGVPLIRYASRYWQCAPIGTSPAGVPDGRGPRSALESDRMVLGA